MRFSLHVSDTAASDFGDDLIGELVILLDRTARDLRADNTSGTLRDAHGTRVGSWTLTTD